MSTLAKGFGFHRRIHVFAGSLVFPLVLSACGGGGGSTTTPPPVGPAPPPPPVAQNSIAFKTGDSTTRFLNKATFGALKAEIDTQTGRRGFRLARGRIC